MQKIYIRELYHIIDAVIKFIHYLVGNKFIISTNQQTLRRLRT